MASDIDSQLPEAINKRSRQILEDLYENITKYDHDRVSNILSEFRILTREKVLQNDVLDERCMRLLVQCSKDYFTEAQKCLSNLILNYSHIRESLIEPYVGCLHDRLKMVLHERADFTGTKDHVVLDKPKLCETLYYDLRIIFLLSALCSHSRSTISDRILDPLLKLTLREAEDYGRDNHLLVIECLKTLFNLTLDRCINFQLAAECIKKLFFIVGTERDLSHNTATGSEQETDPTDQLLVNLIHLLTNMPEQVYHELSNDASNKLLRHLGDQLNTLTKDNLRDTILPVLNACANICKYKEDIRQSWFEQILSSTEDFEKRPEEYETLRGRLVKLMTSVDVHIKEIAAEFLYALCGRDTEKFITYTGFGNSAAFLSTRGLLSQSAGQTAESCNTLKSDSKASDSIEINDESIPDKKYRELRSKLDPITGKIDVPKQNPMEGMSEEEKEWHAHELASAIANFLGWK